MSPVTDTVITSTTTGGHTFKPAIATCQECHSGLSDFTSVASPVDVDGDPSTTTVYDSLGDYSKIDWTVAPKATDKGLFNIVRYALYLQNIEADDGSYFVRIDPYNEANHVDANKLTVWTAAQQQIAFNFDSLENTTQGNAVYVHNYYYVCQVLIDGLKSLGVTTNPHTSLPFQRPTTPPGGSTRPATDYSKITIP
jgi:hypothetical protein